MSANSDLAPENKANMKNLKDLLILNGIDLGEIQFLADYPEILCRLIDLEVNHRLAPFFQSVKVGGTGRGFVWSDTPEGWDFWHQVLVAQRPAVYYERYPERGDADDMIFKIARVL